MSLPASSPAPLAAAPEAAVLLVLLPHAAGPAGQPAPALVHRAMEQLQAQFGAGIRVLKIDEASHPAVVRSFHVPELPAWVLMREGIELGRELGLPQEQAVAALLYRSEPASRPALPSPSA